MIFHIPAGYLNSGLEYALSKHIYRLFLRIWTILGVIAVKSVT